MAFRYLSLFSGAGGLDVGLERAGLEVASLCELEKVFCSTLKANQGWKHSDGRSYLGSARILHEDVSKLGPKDLLRGGKVDLVVGGPPCQAFSSSGKQRSVLDPRGALVSQFYRVIEEVKPKMFLFENVRGLVTARDRTGEPGGVITQFLKIMEDLGYSCRSGLLNSADYGSYQRRVRCFVVGSRRGSAPNFPAPRFHKSGGLYVGQWRSLESFLEKHADDDEANYTYPTPKLAEQLKDLPNGTGLKSVGRTEATRPGGHWGYRQGCFIADPKLPARTVTGSSSQDWVRWNGVLRRLTFKEVKLLQGFPEDWIVEGNKAEKFKQIGNAVPSVFGEELGKVIISHLSNFPSGKPVFFGVPKTFESYMSYTKRDQARNHASRTVHRQFQ